MNIDGIVNHDSIRDNIHTYAQIYRSGIIETVASLHQIEDDLYLPSLWYEKEIINVVSSKIGPISKPSKVYFVKDIPKTRSGKMMRRILKSLLEGEEIQNVSTLINPCLLYTSPSPRDRS